MRSLSPSEKANPIGHVQVAFEWFGGNRQVSEAEESLAVQLTSRLSDGDLAQRRFVKLGGQAVGRLDFRETVVVRGGVEAVGIKGAGNSVDSEESLFTPRAVANLDGEKPEGNVHVRQRTQRAETQPAPQSAKTDGGEFVEGGGAG